MSVRSALLVISLSLACSKDPPTAAGKDAAATPAPTPAPAGNEAKGQTPPTFIDPAVLAAKLEPSVCAMITAPQVQALLGLAEPPATDSGTATAPPRTHCRYRWTDADGESRFVEVAWAHSLADQPDKVARGLALMRADITKRRLQQIELPGTLLASWGEGWLTVYANEYQVFWVVMDDAGKTPRESKNLAAAIAASVLHSP